MYTGANTSRNLRMLHNSLMVVLFAVAGLIAAKAPAQDAAEAAEAPSVPADASVDSLFVEFLHYARLGRFTLADAYARALLDHPSLDPAEVLDAASRDKKSVETLLVIIKNSSIGENAARVMELIHRGEEMRRKDADRILANVKNLGGSPQNEYFATKHLAQSGEHAIPYIVATLLDSSQSSLWPRVITALPKLDKPAVTPLAMALRMRNNDVRVHVIRALGEIGYPHAVPYLRKISVDEAMPATSRSAARDAISRIESISGRDLPGEAAALYFELAERYYNEDATVRADPRLDTANVWYWDESNQALTATQVPVRVFGQVMAMRCCEEALRQRNDNAEAIALWLSANIRRESRLGMDVESGDSNGVADPDPTRPAVFPRALYFTQTAGARYAHLVLGRAVKDSDTAVALGAIEALRLTAGEASLVGMEDTKQPLVQALRFPDALVRIRAALALAAALPKSPFEDAHLVVPVLAGAVTLSGREQVLVVDPIEGRLNRVMEVQRSEGRTAIGEKGFLGGVARARKEFESLSALFISADVGEPSLVDALRAFRAEFLFSKTPVVITTTGARSLVAEEVAAADRFVTLVDAEAGADAIADALARVRDAAGMGSIDEGRALEIAMEAVETLRRVAVDGRTVYDLTTAEPALVAALSAPVEELQTLAASVLALIATPSAQRAVAAVALDAAGAETLRVSAFGSLAESAKTYGNMLAQDQINVLVDIAREDSNLTIRTAASQALGAVSLASNKASEIIRTYYAG